jgi:hypothetical protein
MTFTVGLTLLLVACDTWAGTLRIGAYNTANNPDDATEDTWFSTIFSALGQESVNGLAQHLDVLAVEETDTGSAPRLPSVLNSLYGVSAYQVVRGCESNAVFHFFGCVPSRGSLDSFMSSEITS